jgi:hypothetical protein
LARIGKLGATQQMHGRGRYRHGNFKVIHTAKVRNGVMPQAKVLPTWRQVRGEFKLEKQS